MTLNTNTKLGPYEILSPLGAGGMGEVYRARDSRLDRDVAIKPLFQTRESWLPGEGLRYDVSEDGQRFLLLVPQDDPTTSNISLVVHWPEELKGK